MDVFIYQPSKFNLQAFFIILHHSKAGQLFPYFPEQNQDLNIIIAAKKMFSAICVSKHKGLQLYVETESFFIDTCSSLNVRYNKDHYYSIFFIDNLWDVEKCILYTTLTYETFSSAADWKRDVPCLNPGAVVCHRGYALMCTMLKTDQRLLQWAK